MPSSRARLPPDPGVPARFSKYYDNIYPRTLLRDRLTVRWENKREGEGLFISVPPMNPALSRGIAQYPSKFLRGFLQ